MKKQDPAMTTLERLRAQRQTQVYRDVCRAKMDALLRELLATVEARQEREEQDAAMAQVDEGADTRSPPV